MTASAVGGPGWQIDPDTLLPQITDEPALRAALGDDPCTEALVLLWGGDATGARLHVEALLAEDADNPRLLALQADCWRDCGEFALARRQLEALVAAYAGSEREAVLVQHLGKTLFVAGQLEEAAGCFARALWLREQSGADPDLIASSRLALDRARQLATPG